MCEKSLSLTLCTTSAFRGGKAVIPAPFSYHRPSALTDAIAILSEHGDDARVMAGGHSLIPMMKLRMADIPHLIDLQDIPNLSDITVEGSRSLNGDVG